MSVEFGGMGSMVVTMKAVAVTTGGIAGMDGNDTVRNANGGVAPVGVVLVREPRLVVLERWKPVFM